MAIKTVAEFFSAYLNIIPETCADGEILRFGFSKDNTSMAIEIKFSRVISLEDLKRFAVGLKSALGISEVYIGPKYAPELFNANAMLAVIEELKRRCPVNGFFENAEYIIDGEVVRIILKNGGESILKRSGAEEAIPRIISKWFGLNKMVEFSGNLSVDREFLENERVETLCKMTPPPPPPSSSAGGAKPAPADLGGYNIQLPSDDILPDATIIMGRAITGVSEITNLVDLNDQSGRVTVVGDIVSVDSRTTKDGKRMILTVIITDYSSSMSVKIIELVAKAEAILEAVKPGKTVL